jgi:uncharacterized protein YegL
MMDDDEALRLSYTCSISHEIMTDPVIAADGHSYDRAQIERWFLTSNRSPLTGEEISTTLHPNVLLRNMINEYNKKQNEKEEEVLPIRPPSLEILGPVNGSFEITARSNGTKTPARICLLLDTSTSMEGPARSRDGGDISEMDRLTRMDLVQHSVNTMIAMLREDDSICLIEFNSDARIVLEWTTMTQDGKQLAKTCVDRLMGQGNTNLTAGLKLAYDVIDKSKFDHCSLVLLTDGEPTPDCQPPRGYTVLVEDLAASKRSTLYCCGFGYHLDSPMLFDIARVGGGVFSHIPDLSMCGTVFIHVVANIHQTVFPLPRLYFECVKKPPGGKPAPRLGYEQDLGSLRDGIPFMIKLPNPDYKLVKILTQTNEFPLDEVLLVACTEKELNDMEKRVDDHHLFCSTLKGTVLNSKTPLAATFMKSIFARMPEDFQQDIESFSAGKGQIMKAIEDIATQIPSWGLPYLCMVLNAHTRQIKLNFKDVSMARYSNKNFNSLTKLGEDIFAKIPLPAGTLKRLASKPGSLVALSNSCSSRAGCFSRQTKVRMEDGQAKEIGQLKRGDRLLHGFEVDLLILFSNQTEWKEISSNLGLTDWHPYRANSKSDWMFPPQTRIQKGYVVNLVLKQGHYVETVDGYQCVTLGHGFNDDPVTKHEFYGTQRCVEELKKMPNTIHGLILVEGVKRSESGGLVIGWI